MYQQLIEQIKQRIAVGDWPPGMLLPSIRQLAVDTKVSVITVKRAYLELERESVIHTQHGKGSVVSNAPDLAPRLYEAEFSHHLEQTVRLAGALGMTREELHGRVDHAYTPLEEARS
jgi:GntR family transcriptional regulator